MFIPLVHCTTMNPCQFPFILAFLCFLIALAAARNDDPTQPTHDVSVNCGSREHHVAPNGRKWHGDRQQKHSSLLQLKGLSTVSTPIQKLALAQPVPYSTARASRSQFSYTFQVDAGQKIIRLHFKPTPYQGFKGLHDLFAVEAGPFIFLSNFSASLTAAALGVNSFVKDFCLYVNENEKLNISFTPESSLSVDTYVFVNGIEIISVPDTISYFQGGDVGLQVLGQRSAIFVDDSSALEIVHRFKIKKDLVPFSDDLDIFPKWATRKAENVKSNTWKIAVQVGFNYLIRLHFSGLGLRISKTKEVLFDVLIDEMVAFTNTDMGKESEENGILRYRDYMLTMRGLKREAKRDISICIRSYDELVDGNELLEGFEIVKLSNIDNSLASPSSLSLPKDSPSLTIQNLNYALGHRDRIAAVIITVICLVNVIVHKLRERWEANSLEEGNKPSARAERLCRHFSLAEIQLATRNFCEGLLIGRGGFGKVYKGLIDSGQTTVAVKRLKSNSKQGAHEFLTEIETLSQLRHVNLVSLIGYCNEKREMILVYEYMVGGTLADHLYKLPRYNINYSYLTWKQRLHICIGAGRGLDYLHTSYGVIHRDIKASNILLDENLIAKICDFGLAKTEDGMLSHVTTNVKGTFGYFDPSYFRSRRLTRKSDTYAFGVVLLEVLCGRAAVDSWVAGDEHILSWWARDMIKKGRVNQIVDPSLRDEIRSDSINTFVGIADRCLSDELRNRPTMSQVVSQLEFALEQQESKQNVVVSEIQSVPDNETDLSANTREPTITSTYPQKATLSRKQQTNSNVVSAHRFPSEKKLARNAVMNKPPRPWLWGELWNRVKPSKKSELFSSGKHHSKTNIHIQVSAGKAETFEADIPLPKFSWATIAASTNRFSSSNIVGRGGSGKVYKAVLPTGKVVAVKRQSPASSQAMEDFKAEILLLSSLQHRNVIKLLGYCTHRDEKLLVYEFMENRSLETFIGWLVPLQILFSCWKINEIASFGFHNIIFIIKVFKKLNYLLTFNFIAEAQHRHSRLQWLLWSVRFKVILGIARGLVYLHQDSGLRVIYRDLKSRNILLDADMNPKITGFEFSRTLEENQHELETTETAGTTSSYMPPEYLEQGKLSLKSDVYSFGIIVLEIVSSRRVWNIAYGEAMKFLPSYVSINEKRHAYGYVNTK
ncbi:receptor-like protein kinase FERONIA [Salvia splendens]|uniref:receptor-like protein kinase FERONIA n=1 Tax=Salvia splendens TaxID=180675 RepID=UPI001C2673F4|nr:receptor-like protein kinase FERONIA [Salvia splendens]